MKDYLPGRAYSFVVETIIEYIILYYMSVGLLMQNATTYADFRKPKLENHKDRKTYIIENCQHYRQFYDTYILLYFSIFINFNNSIIHSKIL